MSAQLSRLLVVQCKNCQYWCFGSRDAGRIRNASYGGSRTGKPINGMTGHSRRLQLLFLVVGLVACSGDSIEWRDARYDGPPQPPFGIERGSWIPSTACEASLRVARDATTAFATWWEPSVDGSSRLILARIDSSGSAATRSVVDSTDRSARGCGRPAPAIALSPGYIHLAYFAEATEGPGIFYLHSMDGGRTFHTPVAIVYGRNPAAVSVAASGDTVVVAYEDPNSVRPAVGLSLSHTTGHIFSVNSIASPESSRATLPVVRIKGRTIQLWWSERSPNPIISATKPVYREGHF
jgi:hypothetical protein